jgi:transcriptional regulator with XRE-family HTH domain
MDVSFGTFVRNKRLEKGYTLRKFSEIVEISPTFVSRMERDEIDPPGEEKIIAMAQALSMDAEELIFKAKRMPADIKKMVINRPDLVPLLRIANTKNTSDLKQLIDLVAGRKD